VCRRPGGGAGDVAELAADDGVVVAAILQVEARAAEVCEGAAFKTNGMGGMADNVGGALEMLVVNDGKFAITLELVSSGPG